MGNRAKYWVIASILAVALWAAGSSKAEEKTQPKPFNSAVAFDVYAVIGEVEAQRIPGLGLRDVTDAGLELWIETNNAHSFDITRNRYASEFAFGPDLGSGPGKARSALIFGAFENKPSTIAAAWRKTPEGYNLEFLLPAQMLAPAKMDAGTTMGVHYALFNDGSHAEDSMNVFPAEEWQEATAESQGLDPKKLNEAMEVVKRIAQDHSDGTRSQGNSQCVVIRNGYIIWKGTDIDNKHPVYSCTKSFMSATFGLLVDDGKCTLDSRAADFLPSLREHYPTVTVRQFGNLTSGYNVPWSQSALQVREPIHAPGAKFHYSASSDQLANVLTRIGGEPLRDLFKRRIAGPIGMEPDKLSWDDLGEVDGLLVCRGATGISITAREMARFGLLFLNKGRWNGKQILSEKWVEESTSPQVPASVPPYDPKAWYVHLPGCYGINWWVNGVAVTGRRNWPSAPPKTFAAQGNRNNYCFVIPEWNMVVVRMGTDGAIDSALYDGFFQRLKEAFTEEP